MPKSCNPYQLQPVLTLKSIFYLIITQVDKEQFEKVLEYIEHGKREGATLRTGGELL